ncbi:MAG: ABC-F family ATP-binding cassette domain-containing protein [Deltaproteobacteria bacterium]
MITISNLSLFFGDRVLFENISFNIKDNDKIGIVGRNGSGKTTLFKLITGEMRQDNGSILIPGNKTLGYLRQELHLDLNKTVIDETHTAFDELLNLQAEILELENMVGKRTDYNESAYIEIIQRIADLNEIIKNHDVGILTGNVEKVLKGLGFKPHEFGKKINELSGGWQIRIEIAKLLLRQPDYILLDEPTNHLDIEAIIWLEEYLKDYQGAVLLISHDQRFLDNVTKRTLEIENTKVYDYPVSYTGFIQMRDERREKLISAYKNQQNIIKEHERTIERFMAKATKTKLAQSMQKKLDKIERIEVEEFDTKTMKLVFPPAERSGQIVVKITGLSKSFKNLNVLQNIDFQLERGDKISFVGQNGQGKTTLAKIIIGKLEFEKGNLNLGHNVKVGYYAQNQSDLLETNLTVLETMENNATLETRANIRKLLGAFLFSGEDVDKKVSVLSGGEKARLAIAVMLLRPFNLLVLDEPTNHLDILSKQVLKQALEDFNGSMIIVSHDREFLSGLSSKTLEFKEHKLNEYLGDINYFLEKRKIDDIRQIEIKKPNSAMNIQEMDIQEIQKQSSKTNFEERKAIQKEIKQSEKKIETIENQIKEIEEAMLNPDFHSDPSSVTQLKLHVQLKEQLEEWMDRWTIFQEKLESLP